MLIHANSFDVDMNELLNQMNSQNGLSRANAIIKKAFADTQNKFNDATNSLQTIMNRYEKDLSDQASKNMSYVDTQNDKVRNEIVNSRENITSFIKNQNYETPQQLDNYYNNLWGHITYNGNIINNPRDMINAVEAEDRYIGQQMTQITQADHQFVEEEINGSMSNQVQTSLNNLKNQFPHNFMEYCPPGQYPSNATAGDICWQTNGVDFNTNAKAFQYDGSNWKPLKTQLDLYASNIYSPNITGGNITGAQFLSQYHGRDGQSLFSVDPNGDIYAHNIRIDLQQHPTQSEINKIEYNAFNNKAKGVNFDGGTLNMTAEAVQDSGPTIKAYNGAPGGTSNSDYAGMFEANTYLEPDYLKLRTESQYGQLLGRTDVRGGNIEISDQWNQNTGVRLGYWNDGHGDVGPDILVGDLTKNGLFSAIGTSGIVTTDINATGQINGGTMFSNGRRVLTSDDRIHPFDPSGLWNQINTNSGTLQQHGIRLDSHDQKFRNDEGTISDHGSTLSDHESRLETHKWRLDQHNAHLSRHDDEIGSLQRGTGALRNRIMAAITGGGSNSNNTSLPSNLTLNNGDNGAVALWSINNFTFHSPLWIQGEDGNDGITINGSDTNPADVTLTASNGTLYVNGQAVALAGDNNSGGYNPSPTPAPSPTPTPSPNLGGGTGTLQVLIVDSSNNFVGSTTFTGDSGSSTSNVPSVGSDITDSNGNNHTVERWDYLPTTYPDSNNPANCTCVVF